MIIALRGSVLRLLFWQWRHMLLTFVLSTIVVGAYEQLGWTWLRLPTMPLAVVGAALGIFVSFRTNSSYGRWWEGRKLWGALINHSRHLALETLHYLPPRAEADKRTILRRHIAYVHTLRAVLRDQVPMDDEIVGQYIDAETRESLRTSSSPTNALLNEQMRTFVRLNIEGQLDDFRLQMADQTIRKLLDVQGGCERIKKTPLPRVYGWMSERIIQWFGALLPTALVSELHWAAIPVSMLVLLCFQLISETGRILEDPFTLFWNGLPLSSMSRTIEINLLELLGESDLPEPWKPNPPHVLM